MRRLRAEWPVLLLALLPLLQYWPAVSGRVMLGPGDGVLMFLPLRAFAAQAWQAGELPLWNPWVFSGFPLLASMTTGVFFPFNAAFLCWSATTATNLVALATMTAFSLGTYAYARTIGCSRAGALLAGVTAAGSGFALARTGNTPMIQAAPWLPWLLIACERLRAAPRLRWIGFGAGAVALALFAGHPQIPAYMLAVAAAYVGWRSLLVRPPAGRLRAVAASAAALGAGVLLALPQLLPSAELTAHSVRAELSFADFVDLALTPHQLAELLFPMLSAALFADTHDARYVAIFEQASYAGVLALGLAGAALGACRRDALAAFWALVAGAALLLMLGDLTPLAWLAYHVPPFSFFRICVRYSFVFDFAVAVLAAIGLSRLQRGAGRRAARVVALALVVVMPAIAVFWVHDGARIWEAVARTGVAAPPVLSYAAPAIVLPLLLGAATVLGLWRLAVRPSRPVVALLVLLQVGDLYLYAVQLTGRYPRIDTALIPPPWFPTLRETAGAGRAAMIQAPGVSPADYRLALWGQPLITGYDSLLLARYAAFAGDMDYAGRMSDTALVEQPLFLDLLSTRALVLYFPTHPAVSIEVGGARFAGPELGVTLPPGGVIEFPLPQPTHVTGVAAISFLGGAAGVGDGVPAAHITLRDARGAEQSVDLLAGEHTAEWAWERADIAPIVRHRRAPVAERFHMGDMPANKYVGVVPLAAPFDAVSVRIANVAPQSQLQLSRVSLLDAAAGRIHALSLAHRLLDQPQRWTRRAGLHVDTALRTAPPLTGAEWLRPLLYAGPRLDGPDRGGWVEILENRQAQPRAWLVSHTVQVDAAQALASVRQARLPDGTPFDIRATAVVEAAPAVDVGPLDPNATATLTYAGAERVEVETSSAGAAFLVVSDVAYPGWQATIDGAPAPIVRTNSMLRGVALPAGRHRVAFHYRPRGIRDGFVGAALVPIGFALAAVWRRRRAQSLSASR
jgi:hypothetical protein